MKCDLCGKDLHPLRYGSIWEGDTERRYCHDDDPRPTCYMRATWGETAPERR